LHAASAAVWNVAADVLPVATLVARLLVDVDQATPNTSQQTNLPINHLLNTPTIRKPE